ncbi:hypothetical protein RFI_21622 [Reticulomyxa filosa]|uniref:Uncharacterized protein n=1 Tax=Reticulomyxa filosa TaxID=46433 RepID=X6MQL6_RETFI|nr:hypothetical protein RFI_21622 [Reticulomyxa filosa]|eukprot:ETO15742.1 hypothetical protein RFI_21622 [Reticulomyxa filosa]
MHRRYSTQHSKIYVLMLECLNVCKANIITNAVWMNRNAVNKEQATFTSAFVNNNLQIDNMMQAQQMQEREQNVRHQSSKSKKKASARQRDDDFSAAMYDALD